MMFDFINSFGFGRKLTDVRKETEEEVDKQIGKVSNESWSYLSSNYNITREEYIETDSKGNSNALFRIYFEKKSEEDKLDL